MKLDLSKPATQAEIAAILGVTQPTVSNWMTEGKLPAAGTLHQVVLAYCQRLRDQAVGRLGAGLGELDLVQERAALARQQRIGIEIKNAVLASQFASVATMEGVLQLVSGSIARQFDLLPAMLASDLPDDARAQVLATLSAARNEWVRATSVLAVSRADGDLGADDDVEAAYD